MAINLKAIASMLVLCLLFITPAKAQDAGGSEIYYINDADINFNQLISKFKNKIIYVDAWATWCGPCRRELRQAKQVRAFSNFAARNDVVILYICCDKDGSKWKQFIKNNNLTGYHFLVNPAVDNDLHTTYGEVQRRESGLKKSFYIPRHFIINRNGVVADSMADRQGSPKLYTKLKQMLSGTIN